MRPWDRRTVGLAVAQSVRLVVAVRASERPEVALRELQRAPVAQREQVAAVMLATIAGIVEAAGELSPRVREYVRDEVLGVGRSTGRGGD